MYMDGVIRCIILTISTLVILGCYRLSRLGGRKERGRLGKMPTVESNVLVSMKKRDTNDSELPMIVLL